MDNPNLQYCTQCGHLVAKVAPRCGPPEECRHSALEQSGKCKWLVDGKEIQSQDTEFAANLGTLVTGQYHMPQKWVMEVCEGDPSGFERHPLYCLADEKVPNDEPAYSPFRNLPAVRPFAVKSCEDVKGMECSCGDHLQGWGSPEPTK